MRTEHEHQPLVMQQWILHKDGSISKAKGKTEKQQRKYVADHPDSMNFSLSETFPPYDITTRFWSFDPDQVAMGSFYIDPPDGPCLFLTNISDENDFNFTIACRTLEEAKIIHAMSCSAIEEARDSDWDKEALWERLREKIQEHEMKKHKKNRTAKS